MKKWIVEVELPDDMELYNGEDYIEAIDEGGIYDARYGVRNYRLKWRVIEQK